MPELPEVAAAARIAQCVLAGQVVASVDTHHPAQRRALPSREARRIAGRTVVRVERRAKHQHLILDDGAIVAVHFRMNGDWEVARPGAPLPRFARVVFTLADGRRLCLVDSRALCHVTYHPPGRPPRLALGPEPDELTPEALRRAIGRRNGAVKTTLLDQRVVAGLGNIYAAEALWRARIHPALRVGRLSDAQLRALVRGIRAAINDGFARQGRYRGADSTRPFKVYDREGRPCARCHTPVTRIAQAGRSTYFCPQCQHAPVGARTRATPRRSPAARP
jgi:formamidopyrimidine-DNA glycosylase